MPRHRTLSGSCSTARRISAVDSSKRAKVLRRAARPNALPPGQKDCRARLEFPCRLGPVVVVRERDCPEQKMRLGFEGVQFQRPCGGSANHGSDLRHRPAGVRGRVEIDERQTARVARHIAGSSAIACWQYSRRVREPPASRLRSVVAP